MRCLARFVRDQQLTWKNKIRATTISGHIRLQLENSGLVTVQMGAPKFEPADIPLDQQQKEDLYTLQTELGEYQVASLSMGNPHALLFVDDVETAPVETLGPMICQHEIFPEQTNVGFIQVIDKKKIKIRVFERGSGETLACGSGAYEAVEKHLPVEVAHVQQWLQLVLLICVKIIFASTCRVDIYLFVGKGLLNPYK